MYLTLSTVPDIKYPISYQAFSMVSDMENPTQSTIETPVQGMIARHQQRFMRQIAAIDQVKSRKARYKKVLDVLLKHDSFLRKLKIYLNDHIRI